MSHQAQSATTMATRDASGPRRRHDIRARADRLIALIDAALSKQVCRILHHPRFRAMEARWRGLGMLLRSSGNSPDVKIRILPASWAELCRAMERASEFDQSQLFELVYSREFDMPGGEPFGLLVGDYEIGPDMEEGRDAVSTLRAIAQVAAAAFCPFVAAASPRLIELGSFRELSRLPDLARPVADPALQRWRSLRRLEDTRFVGLVAPRVLMRPPYGADDRRRRDGFGFREEVEVDGAHLNWGNGAFAFAAVVIGHFVSSGWFADMRGAPQDDRGGGVVPALPAFDSGLESHGLSRQPAVEVRLTGLQEKQISEFGLIPVSTTYMASELVFNSNSSLHQPERYNNPHATQNARISAMVQYVLCASRFAHFLKVILRDEVGRLADALSIENRLRNWLGQYTVGNDNASLSQRRRFPLRLAAVDVAEQPGRAGSFTCQVRLQPHFQLDDVDTTFQLIAETSAISAPKAARA
ncbi:MAG: type VI secretion system contractile sheath large subunit [Alphaproteobacteria bacterium]|nr:type VI secretion system contractile sheath large subunit [Alphaproteobacteria bacterium]